jgi:hypothetical protein
MTKKELEIDCDDYNISQNEHFNSVLAEHLSRRDAIKLGAGLIGSAFFGSIIGEARSISPLISSVASQSILSFKAVDKTLQDTITLPKGYSAKVIYATGDPLKEGISSYANDGSDSMDFNHRSGDCHDGMRYFGLKSDNSELDDNNSSNGLMCINHEYIIQDYLHTKDEIANLDKTKRVASQVDKEIACHGVTVAQITNHGSGFILDKKSKYNRRITASTRMKIKGSVSKSAFVKTLYSPNGTATRGTVNNCSNGYTPWGTYLTCEENWNGYFVRDSRVGKEEVAMKRYGITDTSRYGWESVYDEWNATMSATKAKGDYRNIANTFGYIVEIDPFNPKSTPIKRTTMGRFAHEGCWPAKAILGEPIVFYMGDDSKGEYIYKFVSAKKWIATDARGGLRVGDKYLDNGTMYVAKFKSDGTGEWLKLDINESAISDYKTYEFGNQADVAVHTRIAADASGATKMDRPEWGGIHPITGEVYMTLTNNSDRGKAGKYSPDCANPRYYSDKYNGTKSNKGNVNGHIIRWREEGDNHASTAFGWDIYLFGSQCDADGKNINISQLTDDNDFSSPDGLAFSQATKGLMWIQTDDDSYTDTTNCMLLAAIPGSVGDGTEYMVANKQVPANEDKDQMVSTYVGKKATGSNLKRFLVGPRECEITGITETPDGKTIFVNIQHPGEEGSAAKLTSNFPDGGNSRPRSCTVMITKDDGGVVGY